MSNKVLILLLFFTGASLIVLIGLKGCNYYSTPLELRPFSEEYKEMKPSGTFSHTIGVVGAGMVIIGVIFYSLRKRVSKFWNIGKLSIFLEIHIFLCFVGPILVLYHSTFKIGGIAAISLLTMFAVAISGFLGRFLYTLIPRNLKGNELSSSQINDEIINLSNVLSGSESGKKLLNEIDSKFSLLKTPDGFFEALKVFFHMQKKKKELKKSINGIIKTENLKVEDTHALLNLALSRFNLLQKSVVLIPIGKVFHLWHVIHIPFTIIMFVSFIIHVVVALLLGYKWIF